MNKRILSNRLINFVYIYQVEMVGLSYEARDFKIDCEHCKKEMHFYETELKGHSGDNYQGHHVKYNCEHCGKENSWQGFV